MYEFSVTDYSDQIAKVFFYREDVAARTTAVGIWPNKSGYGFGWVDLVQQAEGTEADDEGNPIIKRRYGLVKLVWRDWTTDGEKWFEGESVGPVRGLLSQEDVKQLWEKEKDG